MNDKPVSATLGRYVAALFSVCAFVACTEPQGLRNAPALYELAPNAPTPLQEGRVNPFVIPCPTLGPQIGATVRRPLSGSSATIAFPAGARVQQAGFGSQPGVVFNVDTLGLVAVSYGDQLLTDQYRPEPGSRYPALVLFNGWCPVVIGGREATVHFYYEVSTVGDATRLTYANDMVVVIPDPSGRPMNIRLIGERRFLGDSLPKLGVTKLLGFVSSVEW